MNPKGLSLQVYILSFGVFVIMLGFGFLMPFFPLFARDLGATTLDIGLLVSIFMITRAMLARFFGDLSDKLSKRKSILLIGSLLYTVMMVAFAYAGNVLELYIIRAIQGVASAAYWPIAEALITDLTPPQYRGRALGVYMTSNNMAFFLGPGLAGAIFIYLHDIIGYSELHSFRITFLIAAVLALLSTLVIAIAVKEPDRDEKIKIDNGYVNDGELREEFRFSVYDSNRAIKVLYVMGLANGFAMGLAMSVGVLYLNEYLGASPSFVSFVFSAMGLINIVSVYPAGWVSDIFGRRGVIIFGMSGSRLISIFMSFATNQWFFGGLMVARSLFFNISSPAFRAFQADLVPLSERGRLFGSVQSFFNIGAIFGPVLGTYLYDALGNQVYEFYIFGLRIWMYGPAINFLISGLIGIFSLLLFIVLIKPVKNLEVLDEVLVEGS